MTMTPTVELKNVSKNFGALQVLKDISFHLNKNESMAILGPSGAGKSTLLHIAGLMEKQSGGDVILNGRASQTINEKERSLTRMNQIGFVFQFHYLLPEFDVLENVLIPARLAGDDVSKMILEAKSLLERLGVGERLHHRPNQLSGGEQQRVALARALIRKPLLLLCDEPTGNLDQQTAKDVGKLIFEEVKNEGVAAMIVTHNEALASYATMSYDLVNGILTKRKT